MRKVGIVSCNKWINKIKEDLHLEKGLLTLGIDSNLISWEDPNVDYSEYDCLIIRSIWGYQDRLEQFYKWLEHMKQKQITMFNSLELIENNIRKDVQFNILQRNGIPTVKTEFIYEKDILGSISNSVLEAIRKQFDGTKLFVVKPIISGSGNNTYLIDLTGNNNRLNNIQISELNKLMNDIIKEKNNGLMIQPFISEIDSGEISSIFIDGQNTHNVRRYPSIFNEKRNPELETDMSSAMFELVRRIESIPEYRDYLYMRADMVEHNKQPIVMEVELTEPDLLTRYIPEEIRDTAIKTLAKRIEKRL
jgi:glutathione synthase/RimK-type ligase-like ATP-grasp enzyme